MALTPNIYIKCVCSIYLFLFYSKRGIKNRFTVNQSHCFFFLFGSVFIGWAKVHYSSSRSSMFNYRDNGSFFYSNRKSIILSNRKSNLMMHISFSWIKLVVCFYFHSFISGFSILSKHM